MSTNLAPSCERHKNYLKLNKMKLFIICLSQKEGL